MAIESIKEDIDLELVKKGYYVFAPRAGSKKDLRAQYPELSEFPEFKSDKLKAADLLFVWFMRCRLSPWYDKPDEGEKLAACIEAAYETPAMRDAKAYDFSGLRFPDSIKAAMSRMEKFNTSSRVENYVYTKTVRDSCKAILSKDVSKMNDAEQQAWLTKAKTAWNLLEETSKAIEGSSVVADEETSIGISNTEGGTAHFRQNRSR